METVTTVGSIKRKPLQGCLRATTAKDDRYFSITVRRNSDATDSSLSRDLYVVKQR